MRKLCRHLRYSSHIEFDKEIVALPTSRRSFLFGRQSTPHDAWSKFLSQAKARCQGELKLLADTQAHLDPAGFEDVVVARELCHVHDVVLALDGIDLPAHDRSRRVLWVQAGSAWGSILPLGETGLWRVDAGCPLPVIQAAGLLEHGTIQGVTNLAQWLAMAGRHQPLRELEGVSQLHGVDWLLPDGTVEVFGPFGAQDAQPLRSLAAQKLVPKLFEIASRPEVQACQAHWSMAFHLDALFDVSEVNLAHLFLGHGGSLGWLVAATFIKGAQPMPLHVNTAGVDEPAVSEIDLLVKKVFDSHGCFLSLPNQRR